MYILCSNELSKQTTSQNYANDLLHCFVRFTSQYYSKHMMVYNVHNLLHVVGDVSNYGCLDNYSAFPFENFMKTLKNMVRGPNKPLHQVAKRLSEKRQSSIIPKKKVLCSETYSNLNKSELSCFLWVLGLRLWSTPIPASITIPYKSEPILYTGLDVNVGGVCRMGIPPHSTYNQNNFIKITYHLWLFCKPNQHCFLFIIEKIF